MVFSSASFLFLFLPILLALYCITPQRYKNALLILASLLFYFWGEAFFVVLMLLSVVWNYSFGTLLGRDHSTAPGSRTLLIAVAGNLALLFAFKYLNFTADTLRQLAAMTGSDHAPLLPPIHLPAGISFFTLQAISYLVDVHRGQAPGSQKFSHVALFITLFPQLIAGPILRYRRVSRAIAERRISTELFVSGAQRFITGLAKKVLIADSLGRAAEPIFSQPGAYLDTPLAWWGLICFTLQIYFDFSAYSDMAIGLGRMFGFRFGENFNYPYIANNLRDLWSRWHISLSLWLRDYVYIPLAKRCRRRWPGSAKSVVLPLLAVFLLSGFWHGASWNFFLWGLIHGICLALELTVTGGFLRRLWLPLRHCYTLLIVAFSLVFFRTADLSHAASFLAALAGLNAAPADPMLHWQTLNAETITVAAVAALGATPLPNALARRALGPKGAADGVLAQAGVVIWYTTLAALAAATIASQTQQAFIYFRF